MKKPSKTLLFAIAFSGTITPLKDHQRIQLALRENNCQGKIVAKWKKTEVVNTSESREKGLSKRKRQMDSDEGMLFVFQPVQQAGFWMKDTYIPLGILFFREDGSISQDYIMRPEADPASPTMTYPAPGPVVAAFEIAPHWIGKLKSKLGSLRACVEK